MARLVNERRRRATTGVESTPAGSGGCSTASEMAVGGVDSGARRGARAEGLGMLGRAAPASGWPCGATGGGGADGSWRGLGGSRGGERAGVGGDDGGKGGARRRASALGWPALVWARGGWPEGARDGGDVGERRWLEEEEKEFVGVLVGEFRRASSSLRRRDWLRWSEDERRWHGGGAVMASRELGRRGSSRRWLGGGAHGWSAAGGERRRARGCGARGLGLVLRILGGSGGVWAGACGWLGLRAAWLSSDRRDGDEELELEAATLMEAWSTGTSGELVGEAIG